MLYTRDAHTSTPGQNAGKVSENILLIVVWVGFAIAAIFYVFRIIVRLKLNSRLGFDDGFATLAILILLAHAVIITLMAGPMYDILRVSTPGSTFVPPVDFMERSTFYLKSQFAAICLFWSCIWAVKASFLAFYRNLTDGLKYLGAAWWVMVAFTTMSYLASVISYPVSCTSFTLGACETPRNIRLSLISLRMSTALDVTSDVMIISLPLILVSRVRLNFRTKMAVASVFLLGGIIMIFAIIRIIVTNKTSSHPEISWLNLWSAIECSIAVTVCCMMVFKQLLTRRKAGYSDGYVTPGYGGSNAPQNGHEKGYENTSPSSAVFLTSNKIVEATVEAIPLHNYPTIQSLPPTKSEDGRIRVTKDVSRTSNQTSSLDQRSLGLSRGFGGGLETSWIKDGDGSSEEHFLEDSRHVGRAR